MENNTQTFTKEEVMQMMQAMKPEKQKRQWTSLEQAVVIFVGIPLALILLMALFGAMM